MRINFADSVISLIIYITFPFQIPPPPGRVVPQQRFVLRRRLLPGSHRRADPTQRLWRGEEGEVSDEAEEHEGGRVGSAGRNVRDTEISFFTRKTRTVFVNGLRNR